MAKPTPLHSLGPFFLPPPAAPDPALAEFWRQVDRCIPAARLTQADRNAIWRHIKASRPDQVAFFEDATVKRLLAAGAAVAFPPELIETARRAMTEVQAP